MNPYRPIPSAALLPLAMAVAACVVLANGTTHAQDVPYVDAVGAYNHANVMTRPESAAAGTDAKADGRNRADGKDGGTISRARFDAIVSDLRSEYHQRSQRDGKPAADAWLKREVAELRQRYTTVQD